MKMNLFLDAFYRNNVLPAVQVLRVYIYYRCASMVDIHTTSANLEKNTQHYIRLQFG